MVRGFPGVWKLLFHDSLSRMGLHPSLFVSLYVFYILSCLLLKRMGCLSGCLVSSASVQKLFCGSCSAFKWSFDEFVGGEICLLILFLHHLRTPPHSSDFNISSNVPQSSFLWDRWNIPHYKFDNTKTQNKRHREILTEAAQIPVSMDRQINSQIR